MNPPFVDLSDDRSFENGFPHEFFTWLREHDPVYWHEPTSVTPDGEGFWGVSRYEDVDAINAHIQHARIPAGDLGTATIVELADDNWAMIGDVVATRRNDR